MPELYWTKLLIRLQTPLSFVTSLYALDLFKPPEGTQLIAPGWNQNDLAKGLGKKFLYRTDILTKRL